MSDQSLAPLVGKDRATAFFTTRLCVHERSAKQVVECIDCIPGCLVADFQLLGRSRDRTFLIDLGQESKALCTGSVSCLVEERQDGPNRLWLSGHAYALVRYVYQLHIDI